MRTAKLIDYNLKYLRRLSWGQLSRLAKSSLRSCLMADTLKELFICPSHACNADCMHCYEKFQHKKFAHSLRPAQVKQAIDEFTKLGGQQVFFCSGEFLLREDALEHIRYARSRDLTVSITSNGLLLDEAKIDALASAGLTRLILSIDSADPARHDRLRGAPGCLEKVMAAVRMAKCKGLWVELWTYVSRSNAEGLDAISALAENLGADIVFVFFPLLSGRFFDKPEENLSFEERESFRKRYNPSSNVLLEFPTERTLCRGGGKSHICVMPSGDVTFCPAVPYSYGKIGERSLRDCLADIRADYRRFLPACRGQCPVNSPDYRKGCSAQFMYKRDSEERP
ncbi:MAG: radical SAM protein [Elusimicrobiota bacterium]|jgi:MoaA/NifB/PqqE/SkfB family radical SAM enzyme